MKRKWVYNMEDTIKYKIITLGNGNKYFVFDQYEDETGTYNLVLNIDDEKDIEVVKQEKSDSKLILKKLEDDEKTKELVDKFKSFAQAEEII